MPGPPDRGLAAFEFADRSDSVSVVRFGCLVASLIRLASATVNIDGSIDNPFNGGNCRHRCGSKYREQNALALV